MSHELTRWHFKLSDEIASLLEHGVTRGTIQGLLDHFKIRFGAVDIADVRTAVHVTAGAGRVFTE